MKIVSGSITSPKGFKAAGIHSCMKRKKLDLGLLYSEVSAQAAGVFTSNKLRAPHIDIDKKHLKKGKIQAVLVNSGNANCYNGKKGYQDALSLVRQTSKHLNIDEESVLIASTGLIAEPLPVDCMKEKIKPLTERLKKDTQHEFAQSILTTDKKIKKLSVKFKIGKKTITISACAKGSGMIHPEMATTLSFITTDANITKRALKKALKASINNTLNLISVEGDMSPNDSAFILANGQAQNKTIDIKSKSFIQFSKALTLILFRLSELLVKDAEGASKLIRVKVKKAISYKQARRIAFDVANSNLVKTACYGEDPNWGRVVSCVGSSGIKLEPKKIEVSFDDMTVFKNLEPQDYDKSKLRRTFKKKHIDICINLNQGKEELTVLTSDLTPDYVRLNAHYGNYKKWKK